MDGDPRITVLNARINGAGGYFSGSDEVPRAVNRFSNEREMFYMNIDDRPLGSETYSSVLAHEFQHMIQWRQSVRPSTWINEGLSQLAEELNGYTASDLGSLYLSEPDLQLTDWAEDPSIAGAHYGASYLFLSYFYDRYKDQIDLQQLVKQGAGERLQLLAEDAREARPDIENFDQLYADWAVANLLNDPSLEQGRWSYGELPDTVVPEQDDDGVLSGEVAQFGTDYVEMETSTSERVLRFDGSDQIGVIAAEPEGTMWWSERGDDAVSTLTRSFDLRSVPSATLEFRTWFDIEEGYDYAFASVSTNGGTTWTTLAGEHTTTEDPQGANYGSGYTSTSGGSTATWVDERIDLTPYVGQEVMIRFSLISDDAFNRPGMAIDNIRIPEINFEDDAEAGSTDWQSTGWVRTNNELEQRWQLRLVSYEGDTPRVTALTLDGENTAEVRVPANTRAVLVVMATTPHTSERAEYSVSRP
ncbi:MAG: Secreted protease metal-dependent protease [uncultured Chloroflexia bacterium]|uniref:Secreted protease metal-dependent protease n=1 Tax=uncultured Chloroflexia bacterium TaxID=1672391 RepID=A0A6J4I5S6_9CHLR|nr:MAG: Secreted protease metal-dependent protease [uncultured Chloroflexia bacterium]